METLKELRVSPDIWRSSVVEEFFYGLVQQQQSAFVPFPQVGLYQHGTTTGLLYALDLPTMKSTVRESEAANRRDVADAFVARAKDLPYVREVWFEDADEPSITVITAERSLDDELQLEAILIAAGQTTSEPFDGFLRVYVEDSAPSFARSGVQLLA